MSRADWRASAACAGSNPELFFPSGRDPQLAEPAKRICRRCPSVRACLADALTHDVDGVWGGTTYIERERLREQYDITPEPVLAEVIGDSRVRDVARLSGGGYAPVDIARATGIPVSDVHQDLARARRYGLLSEGPAA